MKSTIIMHCTIIIIKTKKTSETGEIKNINKCNYKLTFSNTLFEKLQQYVCLVGIFLGCGDLVNWQF
jgi:hypothetical protein